MGEKKLSIRQRDILEYIERSMLNRGYPPSVREIGNQVGLASPSSVHSHLESLERNGYIVRDPARPRAIRVKWDKMSGATGVERRPVRHVPLVGEVAAGTDVLAQEHIEESFPLPADLTGDGDLFMLKVRGDSMIEAGIYEGDYVVARAQTTADNGEIVIAGIPGEEATIKTYSRADSMVVLTPANSSMEPMVFDPATEDVKIYGRVVTVLRRL